MQPVTMRDVALRVGVSKQTVSAVLNGKPGISAATIARVRHAIEELGYQPNLIAASLRQGHSNMIGLLVTNVANPWFAELARGVEDVAREKGYGVMLCNTYDQPERIEMYVQMLTRLQIVGVINISPGYVEQLQLPKSCIFQPIARLDDQRGGYVATAHLLDLGHHRIACITGSATSKTRFQRLQGYRQALADWGVEEDERLIIEGTFDYVSGLHAVEHIFQRPRQEQPTALFVHQDLPAIGAMAGLKQMGLQVPEDVAVVGYDNLEIAELYDPALTTVVQPVYELGVQTMTRLAHKLEGHSETTLESLDCRFVVRRSTVSGLNQECLSHSIASGTPWNDWRHQLSNEIIYQAHANSPDIQNAM